MTKDAIEISCEITNLKGLHARAAAQIVTLSDKFNCHMEIGHKEKYVSSLSLIKLLTLDAPKGSVVTLRAYGEQADQAVEAMRLLIQQGFGE